MSFGIIVGWSAWLAYFETTWLTFPVQPTTVTTKVVVPGEYVHLSIVRYSAKEIQRSYASSLELICDKLPKGVPLKADIRSVEPGLTIIERDVLIPTTYDMKGAETAIPDSACHIEGRSEIQGQIRVIIVPWRTQDFEVKHATL